AVECPKMLGDLSASLPRFEKNQQAHRSQEGFAGEFSFWVLSPEAFEAFCRSRMVAAFLMRSRDEEKRLLSPGSVAIGGNNEFQGANRCFRLAARQRALPPLK